MTDKPTRESNPGLWYAQQAAASIGGAQVIMPPEKGDWNDYAQKHGLNAVRELLTSLPDVQPLPEPDNWEPVYEPTTVIEDDPLSMLRENIRPQGYTSDGKYAFFPRATGQIVYLSPTQLGKIENLYHLAPLMFWTASTGLTKAGDITAMVTPQLMHLCQMKGVFDADTVRGVGAWRDQGRVVINCGNTLYDTRSGDFVHPNEFIGDGVYVTGPRVFSLDAIPLRNKEAYRLRELCDMLTWRRGMNGTILAGWLVVAAVGGCLSWRPSIWVTGPKGSGKSTVVDDIINGLLRGVVLRMDGGSTEAGLRNMVGESSRPVLMDEAESEAGNAANMEKILFWVRRAASGGVVVNYNGVSRAQSCVCLSGINPSLSQGADKDRITLLELEVNTATDASEHYERVLSMISETITPEFSNRLMRRVVDNIDTLLANIDVFVKCASKVLGSKRAGDQIGPMLAGAYMLGSTGRVTPAKADEWIEKQDWSWFEEDRDSDDATRLIQRILTAQVRHTSLDRTSDIPVLDLIHRVADGDAGWQDAEKTLGRYGMAYDNGRLLVANNSDRLSDLLKDTVWRVYKPTLSRYNGCVAGAQAMYFKGGGGNHRYMSIPLEGLV